MTGHTILVVEDEAIVALDIQWQLQEMGYRVLGPADSAERAMSLAQAHKPDLALMDIHLKGPLDGVEAAAFLGEQLGVPVVFLTAHSDVETVRRAALTAPYGFLTKPFQSKELRAGIEVALTKSRLERQLKEADRWFASTLQCVQDGVVVTELDATVRFLNPAAEAMTGWRAEEAVGRPVDEVVRFQPPPGSEPAGLAERPSAVTRALQDGQVVGVQHGGSLVRRQGGALPTDQSAGPVNDEQGQRMGAVVVLRDASERQRKEQALRDSERRFRDAFDHAPLGMALVALDGLFIQVNDAFCAFLGRDAASLRGQPSAALSHPQDAAREAERVRELLHGEVRLVQFEKRYLSLQAPSVRWSLVSVSLLSEGEQPTCLLYQVHDLTEQKKAAEQLAEIAEERIKLEVLQQTHRIQSDFYSRVSHEMRTPLNAVLGFAQLLKLADGRSPADAKAYAQHIVNAGNHLLAMVNDVIDVQKATDGLLTLRMGHVALREAADGVCALLTPMAQARQVALHVDIDEALGVWADPTRLRQVLLNLLSNAVKYNREGGEVRVRAQALPPGHVELVVQDTGLGMTPEQLARLFQPFDRLGREELRIDGVGLGLVITRSLVERMGGTLRFESEAGHGTRAVVVLQANPGAGA